MKLGANVEVGFWWSFLIASQSHHPAYRVNLSTSCTISHWQKTSVLKAMSFLRNILGQKPEQSPLPSPDSGKPKSQFPPSDHLPIRYVMCRRFRGLRRCAITFTNLHTLRRLCFTCPTHWSQRRYSPVHKMVSSVGTYSALGLQE